MKRQKSKEKSIHRKTGIFWGGLLLFLLLLNLAARFADGFAEWYAATVYPFFVGTLGRFCSLFPFSVAELLLYGGMAAVLIGMLFLFRKKWTLRRAAELAGKTALVLLLLFTLNCGINYHRQPFSERAGFSLQESTEEELYALCAFLVEEINASAEEILTDEEGLCRLNEADELEEQARAAMRLAGKEYEELAGYYPKAKPVLSTWYLSYQFLQGIYSPFTVEANYNREMPAHSKPSTICHELSHLKGFMREDEANFIAYLACRASEEPVFRYSGSLMAYLYSGNALYARNPEAYTKIREQLCEQAVRDLEAHNAYWAQYEGTVSEISDKMNDTYLKANAQQDGTQSYGRMVDLLLAWNRERVEGQLPISQKRMSGHGAGGLRRNDALLPPSSPHRTRLLYSRPADSGA